MVVRQKLILLTEVMTIISIIKVKINIFLIENINLKRRIGKLAFAKGKMGFESLDTGFERYCGGDV